MKRIIQAEITPDGLVPTGNRAVPRGTPKRTRAKSTSKGARRRAKK